jgi:hypothetical protein
VLTGGIEISEALSSAACEGIFPKTLERTLEKLPKSFKGVKKLFTACNLNFLGGLLCAKHN